MDNHIHRIDVFTNKNLTTIQFRCEICFKFFERLEVIDLLDRTFYKSWAEEWHRLLNLIEDFKRKFKDRKTPGVKYKFESKNKYIRISEVLEDF